VTAVAGRQVRRDDEPVEADDDRALQSLDRFVQSAQHRFELVDAILWHEGDPALPLFDVP